MLLRYILQFRRSYFSYFSHLGFVSLVTLTLILFFVSFNKLGIVPFGSNPNEELNGAKEYDVQEQNTGISTFEKNMTNPLGSKKVNYHSGTYIPNNTLEKLSKLSLMLFLVSLSELETNPFGSTPTEVLSDTERPDIQRQNINPPDAWRAEMITPDKNMETLPKSSVSLQYKLYKEDQLLSNPGGDNFFLNKASGVIDNDYDHSKFSKRVGKDLTDAGSNLLNVVKDMGLGAKIRYVDNHGEIKEGRKVGFAKTLGNFFKNVASGLTLGAYTPGGEEKPHGGIDRTVYLFKKIFKDAIVGDIVMGLSRSMIYVGEDIMLAGLNTIEVIPDATIGNSKAGRKATTAIFDNTQVVLDFVTDVIPGGEASGRTRSFELTKGLKGLPIINNITTDEKETKELSWRHVRNTKFRKAIETVSSLLPASI
ncbi:MAG TPA: hypothetical protein ENH85_04410 [Candidatus Scalindua sp.]|nr:hypothetical protein [Candidatus Scalindua sp.]